MTLAEQLHNSATHAAGNDPACPVCNPDLLKGSRKASAEVASGDFDLNGPIGRDEAIAQIKAALKARGMRYSVTGGRGTAWGWIDIDLLPAVYKSLDADARKLAYRALGDAFGETHGYGPISVAASSAHYREYIQRARGLAPDKIAEPYWD